MPLAVKIAFCIWITGNAMMLNRRGEAIVWGGLHGVAVLIRWLIRLPTAVVLVLIFITACIVSVPHVWRGWREARKRKAKKPAITPYLA